MKQSDFNKFKHIIESPYKISDLSLSDKDQLLLVKHNSIFFTYLKNPCNKVIKFLAIKDPARLVSYIRIAPFEQQKIIIKHHPNLIKMIRNPNYEIQLIAYKANCLSLNNINNPDPILIQKFMNYLLSIKDLHFQKVYFNLFEHFQTENLFYLLKKTKNPDLITAIQNHKLFKNPASIIIEVIND